MIDLAQSRDPEVVRLLSNHPRVAVARLEGDSSLRFRQGAWDREVRVGDAGTELFGLVELMDNNPLVCADVVSVPSPAATLALIALGPLHGSGLLVEAPTMVTNVSASESDLAAFVGHEVTLHVDEAPLDGVAAATVMAVIRTPDDLEDIDALYDERFERSFFVRRDEESEWNIGFVKGQPFAAYRLRIGPDQPNSLLTIRVMADLNGKAGAAQVVHAMNVMAGFEESLGIS